jgi:hypothetical protein
MLDVATLREELAAIERQIAFDSRDGNLISRYLAYARKIRELEHRENGYVTARARVTEY